MIQSLGLVHFPSQWISAQVIVIPRPGKPDAELSSNQSPNHPV